MSILREHYKQAYSLIRVLYSCDTEESMNKVNDEILKLSCVAVAQAEKSWDDVFKERQWYHSNGQPVQPIAVCDVFKYGQCSQCDHPCKEYFER